MLWKYSREETASWWAGGQGDMRLYKVICHFCQRSQHGDFHEPNGANQGAVTKFCCQSSRRYKKDIENQIRKFSTHFMAPWTFPLGGNLIVLHLCMFELSLHLINRLATLLGWIHSSLKGINQDVIHSSDRGKSITRGKSWTYQFVTQCTLSFSTWS